MDKKTAFNATLVSPPLSSVSAAKKDAFVLNTRGLPILVWGALTSIEIAVEETSKEKQEQKIQILKREVASYRKAADAQQRTLKKQQKTERAQQKAAERRNELSVIAKPVSYENGKTVLSGQFANGQRILISATPNQIALYNHYNPQPQRPAAETETIPTKDRRKNKTARISTRLIETLDFDN